MLTSLRASQELDWESALAARAVEVLLRQGRWETSRAQAWVREGSPDCLRRPPISALWQEADASFVMLTSLWASQELDWESALAARAVEVLLRQGRWETSRAQAWVREGSPDCLRRPPNSVLRFFPTSL